LVGLNGHSDLTHDLLNSFVLLFNCDNDPVVEHVEDLVSVDRDLVEQEQGVGLELVQPEVEVPLLFQQELGNGRFELD